MPALPAIAPARIGAQVTDTGVDYLVWAPGQRRVEAFIERGGVGRRISLAPEARGYWSGHDPAGRSGDLYRFKLTDGPLLPDVASRFQPEGVHGRSECIDHRSFIWKSADWRRPAWRGQPIYEAHIGTFTPEGTFHAAIPKLDPIRQLGIKNLELMPVADFAGEWNWGYDGVALFAPTRCYGRPDDLRALVDGAHARGLAVILDVVYNHVGPQGNYLHHYSPDYFGAEGNGPWGRAFNLDGENSGPVREFVLANVAYWLDEFRFDGLRLDATHAIPDSSPRHILAEIARVAHAAGAFVIAEDERNCIDLLRNEDEGGYGIDATWADDFHHQVRVALTGTKEGYYSAYRGGTGDLAQTIESGWTYRGEPYPPWNGRPRGAPCRQLPASAFVFCIENHDQVGNRAKGERLEHLVGPEQFRAASMLLCLGPYAPLIFMGQEWAASTPFLFFSNHGGELGRQVSEGRRREIDQGAGGGTGPEVPDPEAAGTHDLSKLRWDERSAGAHAGTLALYQACLRERRRLCDEAAFERERWTVHCTDGLVAIRYHRTAGDRLLIVALRDGARVESPPPAFLATVAGCKWKLLLASESARFGGTNGHIAAPGWDLHRAGAIYLESCRKGGADATD